MTETPWRSLLKEASALREAGRVGEAIAAYQRLLAANPDLPGSWYNLGWLQKQARRFDEALDSYRQALDRGVDDPEEVHLNRAVILSDHLGRPRDALGELEAALALNPAYVPGLLNLGNLHEDRGDKAAARDAYQRALELQPENALALARLAQVSDPDGPDDPLIERVRAAAASPQRAPAEKADLGFALGRLLDQAGDHDSAFEAYSAANRASAASYGPQFRGYDPRAQEQLVDRLIAAFPEPAQPRPSSAGRAPLFICGLFRSGSTLVEQILAGHSRVTAGGELDLVPALVDRIRPYPDALLSSDPAVFEQLRRAYLAAVPVDEPGSIFTDKRPDNFLHIGLIKAMFPEAKIVHTRRDPLDNLLSLYFLHLDPTMAYALDLKHAAHWHGEYRRLMAHWKALYGDDIHDLDYDALVLEPRAVVERLLAFCGLEWEDECLDFHSGDRVVKTASVWQVRQPLYTRSSGRWRNYQRHLRPLIEALEGD
ncbi:tetratricopeptide repeat-containing sulfotransferase family protein [Sphingomonas sp.]|uniref:tetratricopeptide repeat-containing sulfotransferase family protein n=1 Tax=Sphingomonas sp. TaxID=28214 RepID=UPI0017E391CD|nr:tetratricopeptide repeat-containing sulfotransferase family protein [Sphingomonas sp.]MBA3511929.1 sulfotransferase [Sphingomonas sp.]